MIDKVAAFADKYNMLPRGGVVVAGVSGGADSIALLSVLIELAATRDFEVQAAHFNHRLRGSESERDFEFVQRHCEALGIKCHVGERNVSEYARSHKLGIEAAARELRYDFFESIASRIHSDAVLDDHRDGNSTRQSVKIAVGHNCDDNAETMLLNLARGSGSRGLAGIPPVRAEIIRPLLCVTREEITAYLSQRGISFVEDSSNASDDYARNRVRHHVAPVLGKLNTQFAMHALEAAERLRADDEYLRSIASAFIAEHCADGVPTQAFRSLPSPIAMRVLRIMFSDLQSIHIEAVCALAKRSDGSRGVDVPGGRIICEYDRLIFDDGKPRSFAPKLLEIGSETIIEAISAKISVREGIYYKSSQNVYKSFTLFLFKKCDICGRIVVRPRVEGDSIALLGRNGTKSLKKLFVDEKIPKRHRDLVAVIADDIGPLGVAGIGAGTRAVPDDGDEIIEIKIEGSVYA